MSDLFICHAWEDKELITGFLESLARTGFTGRFIDHEGIKPGQDIEAEIYHQLKLTNAMLVLCSRNLLRSSWCFFEVAYARAMEIPLFTIHVDEFEPEGQLYELLTDRLQVNYARDGSAALERLAPN